MWQHRKLIAIFYKPLLRGNLVFSILAFIFFMVTGWHLVLFLLFIKAVGYTLLVGYQYTMHNNIYFYYRNIGLPVRKMYAYAFMFDICAFALMFLIYISIF